MMERNAHAQLKAVSISVLHDRVLVREREREMMRAYYAVHDTWCLRRSETCPSGTGWPGVT